MEILKIKYSIDRKEEFQIKTIIYKDNGIKIVKKEAYSQKSINHIKIINTNYKLLQNSKMVLVKPVLEENSVVFSYIDGESIDSILMQYVMNKDIDGFKEILSWYKSLLLQEEVVPFVVTEQFTRIFGSIPNIDGVPAVKTANIDLNFDNLIKHNEQVTVIDYEWVFDFLVPLNYIIYRAVISFDIKYHLYLSSLIDVDKIFDYLGISLNEVKIYRKMESSFRQYVGKDISIYKEKYLKSNDSINEIINIETNRATEELNTKINEVSLWGKQLESNVIFKDAQIIELNEKINTISAWGTQLEQDVIFRDAQIIELNEEINKVSIWGKSLYEQVLERDRIIEELNKKIAEVSEYIQNNLKRGGVN
ncbi:hypothetical protein [Metasolibacillus meyeri]|uniref:hypothetical protein n=1 Tax=Metasolibacillus meyeri TaxID=1071052 RepID=UPI000D306E65|nr:hypothetical protein [Metasolibacillus meyeri]